VDGDQCDMTGAPEICRVLSASWYCVLGNVSVAIQTVGSAGG
jgi:hypothetical protein